MSTAQPDVAVAVVSWNTADLLRRCLASLQADAEAGRAELWVVDNASTDGSADMVEREFPEVQLIRSEENLGFGRAVNLVAERSDGEWVAAANADIELEPGALARLLETGAADPHTAIVAPRLVGPGGETQHSVHAFPALGLSLVVGFGLWRLAPGVAERLLLEGHWDPERGREIRWAHGALLLIRREAFEQVGGFDREQWMYAEDIDLAWRFERAGWRSRYEPAARVGHELSAATRQAFGAARRRRLLEASFAWLVRRRGLGYAWAFAAINFASSGIRWAFYAVLAAFAERFADRREHWREMASIMRSGLRSRRALLALDAGLDR